ncbi:hypothetical protein MD535_25915, partial [Vibrio sp. ZSDZ65]|nr:hypothetical protein [Vibrio qingdaonensis]
FMTVNDHLLTLRTGYHTRRNTIVVPWMLMLTILTLYFLYDSSHKYDFESQKARAERMIESYKEDKARYINRLSDAQKEGDKKKEDIYRRGIALADNSIKGFSIYFEQDG